MQRSESENNMSDGEQSLTDLLLEDYGEEMPNGEELENWFWEQGRRASEAETATPTALVQPTAVLPRNDIEAAAPQQHQHTPRYNWIEEISVAINIAGLFNVLLALTSEWGSASTQALLKTSCPYGENGTQHNLFKDAPKWIFFSLIPVSMGIGYVAQRLLRHNTEALRVWRLLRSEIIDAVETSLFWSLFIVQNKLPKGLYAFEAIVAAKLASIMYHLVDPNFKDGARQVISRALPSSSRFYIAMAEVSCFNAMSLVAATNAIIYTFIDTFWYTEHNPAPPSSVIHFKSVALGTACALGLLLPWINQSSVQAGWFSEGFINSVYYIFNPINSIIDCVSGGKTMSPSGFKAYGWGIATLVSLASIPAALVLALDNTKQHYAPLGEQGGWLEPAKAWVGNKVSSCCPRLFSRSEERGTEEEQRPLLNLAEGGTINAAGSAQSTSLFGTV